MIYKKDTIDMSLVQCQYEEEHEYIYIADEYTNNILKLSGYNDIDEDDYVSICASGKFTSLPYYYSTKSYEMHTMREGYLMAVLSWVRN